MKWGGNVEIVKILQDLVRILFLGCVQRTGSGQTCLKT